MQGAGEGISGNSDMTTLQPVPFDAFNYQYSHNQI